MNARLRGTRGGRKVMDSLGSSNLCCPLEKAGDAYHLVRSLRQLSKQENLSPFHRYLLRPEGGDDLLVVSDSEQGAELKSKPELPTPSHVP